MWTREKQIACQQRYRDENRDRINARRRELRRQNKNGTGVEDRTTGISRHGEYVRRKRELDAEIGKYYEDRKKNERAKDPTEQQISEMCAIIQRSWTPYEKELRDCYSQSKIVKLIVKRSWYGQDY